MKKVFWGFVVLLCLLFAGCSNVIQIGSQVENTSKSLKITAKIAGDCGSFGYRSIMPASITYSKLYYYLLATNYYSKDVIEPSSYTKLTVEGNSNSGIIEITDVYEPAYYIFELYGLKERLTDISPSNIKDKAVLSSVIYKDTRYSSELNFELSSAGINKNGFLKLKIFTTSNWECNLDKYSVTATLYNLKSEAAGNWTISSLPKSGETLSDFQIKSPDSGFENGTYNLNIEFCDKNTGAKYIYSSGVYIYGNQTTEQSVYIPDIIVYAPAAPSDFTASYKIMDSGSAYYADFSWSDNSNNEHYFEMEVKKLDSSVSDTSLKGSADDFSLSGESVVLGTSLSETYYDSTVNAGSNLLHHSGSKMSVKLKFALGEKYIVRLRAVNDGGESDWCYLNLSSPETQTLPEGYSDSSGSKFICVEKVVTTAN